MRRDLSRLSPLSKLFIHHPYSQSSKASNPRLPRRSTDREADRRAGCKSVHKMFNTLSMTEHFTFTKFPKWYQHGAAKHGGYFCGNPDLHNIVQMHKLKEAQADTHPTLQKLRRSGNETFKVCNFHKLFSFHKYTYIDFRGLKRKIQF